MSWPECSKETVAAFVKGDNEAFEEINNLFGAYIESYAESLFKDDNAVDAEDIVQEVWLKAWESREQFNIPKNFTGWLYNITKNACIDIKRQQQKNTKAVDIYAENKRFANVDPVEELTTGEDKARLKANLHKLSPILAECLRLRYYGHLSYEALAEALDIPKGTVMSRLNEAHKKLKELW